MDSICNSSIIFIEILYIYKANDDRIGQEQLYESLEKVLNDLRNFTDHSLPFLKPVQKKEAPDYYDIIKKPMDLGTMAKKLKAQQYNSKEEFVTDLNLIWSNCMLYNTVPDSIYRRHASSMKRKAYELMKKVPDICVKSVPADDSDSEDAGSRIDGVDSIRTQSISGDFTPIVATNLSMLPFANVDLSANATDVSPSVQNTVDDLSSTDVSSRAEAEMLQKQMQREQDLADEEAENAWLQTKRWKDVTYKYRYSRLKFQETQLRIPFAERQAIIRTADGMRSFVESYRQFLLRNTERRRTVSERPELLQKFESDALIDDAEEVKLKREAFRRSFLPEIKHVYCAFPGLDPIPTNRPGDIEDFFRQRDDFESGSTTRQSMSEYKQYNPDYSSPLNIALINAIQELRSIKDVYYKIISKQSPSAINTLAEEYHATIPRVIPYTPVSNAQQLALFSINGESAFAALEKSVNLLVCHAGFDVISQSASTALTQIAMTFMNNMGKVLRLQLDDNDRDLTPETMLSALFSSNRLYDSIRLKQYIQGTLIKSQTKLADLRQKLEYALLEYDEWVDHLVSNGDIEFGMDHTADQIVSGNFFDDVGFDTLNLRELGFDFTHIPAKLWNMKAEKPIRSRLRRMVSQDEIEDDGDKISLESVPSVDAAKQAAAPKSFYEKMNMPIEQLAMEDIRTKIREEQQSLKQVSKRMLSAATEEPKKKQKAATASNVLEKEGASSSTPGAIVSPSSSVAGASAGDVEPPVKSEKQKKSSKGRSKAAKEKSKLSQSHVEK